MDYVKKYWFVGLVAILFCCAIGYFAAEESKSNFSGKSVNGQDVVFEYNGTDVTADDLYDEFFDDLAPSLAVRFVQMGLYRNAYEPSAELIAEAEENYEQTVASYRAYYGESYEDYLLSDLYSLGYSSVEDLKEYFITMLMNDELEEKYTEEHEAELYAAYAEAKHPRILEHILVKTEDPENPTEEEMAKITAIEQALADGVKFETVAEDYSDDLSSVNGGLLGFSDDDTSYVSEFLNAAKALEEGEVTSEWVVHKATSTSDYSGWHLIKCVSTSYEDFKDDSTFLTNLSNYSDVSAKVLQELYANANIDYHGHDSVQELVESYLQASEEE